MVPFLDMSSHTTKEITENFADKIGLLAYNLNKKNMLMENKKEFIEFY